MRSVLQSFAWLTAVLVFVAIMPVTADEEYSVGLSERDLQKLRDFIGSTEMLAPEVQLTLEAGRYRVQSGDTLSGIFNRFYKENGAAINHDPSQLLRTQDLEKWMEENSTCI